MDRAEPLSAERICRWLELEPHPTCGFVAETYRSSIKVSGASLPPPYGGPRPIGSALYFLVTPEAHIRLHRIRSDQQYHHYLGDPLEVLMLLPDGSGRVATVGNDLAAGRRPQLFIPGQTFHMARLQAGGQLALLGSTEWPGVEPADVETGDPQRLAAAYPALREQILDFAGIGAGRLLRADET
jgi:predicted cupin superfamily sugar epimerase